METDIAHVARRTADYFCARIPKKRLLLERDEMSGAAALGAVVGKQRHVEGRGNETAMMIFCARAAVVNLIRTELGRRDARKANVFSASYDALVEQGDRRVLSLSSRAPSVLDDILERERNRIVRDAVMELPVGERDEIVRYFWDERKSANRQRSHRLRQQALKVLRGRLAFLVT